MQNPFIQDVANHIATLKAEGTYKQLKHLEGPMDAHSSMREAGGDVVVLSSNNYLGLSAHPKVVDGAMKALVKYGHGTASVRFICGTMTIHEELEKRLARFHKCEAALTYSSCWSANTGLFAVITKPGDVLISDALNHASIIDGCRLVHKEVKRAVYPHSDMEVLEKLLAESQEAPNRFVVTDGVFSMEGDIAKMPEITALCQKYNAILIVDDSHGVGVMGATGAGVAEHFGVEDKVDIYTGTLGKALGGAAGGYVCAKRAVIDLLIQNSRPHIFSNAISPATAGGALAALDVLESEPVRLIELHEKVTMMREGLKALGFNPLPGESAIVPIIVGETAFAIRIAEEMLKEGFFVTGFGFPVVPEGTARLRVQISSALSDDDIEAALDAFARVGQKVGLLRAA